MWPNLGNFEVGHGGCREFRDLWGFQFRDEHPSHLARWLQDRLLRRHQCRKPCQCVMLMVTGNSSGNNMPRKTAAPISRTWTSKPQVNATPRRLRPSVEGFRVLNIANHPSSFICRGDSRAIHNVAQGFGQKCSSLFTGNCSVDRGERLHCK